MFGLEEAGVFYSDGNVRGELLEQCLVLRREGSFRFAEQVEAPMTLPFLRTGTASCESMFHAAPHAGVPRECH